MGVNGNDRRKINHIQFPDGFGRTELIFKIDVANFFDALRQNLRGPADRVQIDASVFLAGGLGFGAHAAFADDPAQTEIANDLPLIGLFANGSRGAGGIAGVSAVRLGHHHRAAMINDAIFETHSRRQFATVMQIFVDGVPPGEHHAGNQNFIANFERANLFLGKRKGQFCHKRQRYASQSHQRPPGKSQKSLQQCFGVFAGGIRLPPQHPGQFADTRLFIQQCDIGNRPAIFDLLAGRPVDLAFRDEVDPKHQLRAAGPDDSVILYVVSHGYADPQGIFYLMPYDTGANWGVTEDQLNRCHRPPAGTPDCDQPRDILAHSISSGDLAAWWNGVDAGQMVMILDSCHSGAVPGKEFRPGPLGDPGFGQLSYDKGMQILSASQSTQTEKGTVTAGKARTILVTVLTSVAHDHPQQTLEQWLQGAEATLPSVAKELFPAVRQDDVQLPLLLDFAKHNSNPGVVQR